MRPPAQTLFLVSKRWRSMVSVKKKSEEEGPAYYLAMKLLLLAKPS